MSDSLYIVVAVLDPSWKEKRLIPCVLD